MIKARGIKNISIKHEWHLVRNYSLAASENVCINTRWYRKVHHSIHPYQWWQSAPTVMPVQVMWRVRALSQECCRCRAMLWCCCRTSPSPGRRKETGWDMKDTSHWRSFFVMTTNILYEYLPGYTATIFWIMDGFTYISTNFLESKMAVIRWLETYELCLHVCSSTRKGILIYLIMWVRL